MLEGASYLTIRYTDPYGFQRFEGHPTVDVSINGVAGRLIVDTGATEPILNMTAVRRCGISLSSEPAKTGDFWGDNRQAGPQFHSPLAEGHGASRRGGPFRHPRLRHAPSRSRRDRHGTENDYGDSMMPCAAANGGGSSMLQSTCLVAGVAELGARRHYAMRKPSFIFVSLLLIAAGTLVFLSTRPASPLPITVSFLGYTNGTTGARLAMFLVTNRSTAAIRRWGVFHPEIQQQPGLLSTLSIGPNVFLAPGQSEVISVAPPTNRGVWRVVLDCSRDERRLRFSDWRSEEHT